MQQAQNYKGIIKIWLLTRGFMHFLRVEILVGDYKNTTVAHGGRDMHMEMVKRTTAMLGSEGDRWQQRVV